MHGVKITKGILSFQETLLKNIPTKEEGKKKKKKKAKKMIADGVKVIHPFGPQVHFFLHVNMTSYNESLMHI